MGLEWFVVVMGACLAGTVAVALYFLVVAAVSVFSVFWEWVWGGPHE